MHDHTAALPNPTPIPIPNPNHISIAQVHAQPAALAFVGAGGMRMKTLMAVEGSRPGENDEYINQDTSN